MNITTTVLLAAAALLLAGCSDETKPSESVLESRFSLPCSELGVLERSYDPDTGVLMVNVKAHPSQRFYDALAAKGWTRVGKSGTRYFKDGMLLKYIDGEKRIAIHPLDEQADNDKRPARMPEGEYKVGGGALADIRSIYNAATHRECFNVRDEHLRPFERFLFHADTLPQRELDELLFLACEYNCPSLVAELIRRGANVNATDIHWDALDGDAERESTRYSFRTPLFEAAQPDFYKGGATAEKAMVIIDLLIGAGADPMLGDSPLPYVARMELDRVHFEEVFLHLLDCGLSLDDERVTPEATAEQRAYAEKRGITLAPACFTPTHRWEVLNSLRYLRKLGCPWERAEARLGVAEEKPDAEGLRPAESE